MTVAANHRPLPRTVVCNTGPILALSRVDGLGLIEKVLPSLVIPPAVRDELRDGWERTSGGLRIGWSRRGSRRRLPRRMRFLPPNWIPEKLR